MKTLEERLIEIEALTSELRQYVQKYGFNPKEGAITAGFVQVEPLKCYYCDAILTDPESLTGTQTCERCAVDKLR